MRVCRSVIGTHPARGLHDRGYPKSRAGIGKPTFSSGVSDRICYMRDRLYTGKRIPERKGRYRTDKGMPMRPSEHIG